jgi:hypothetical protein
VVVLVIPQTSCPSVERTSFLFSLFLESSAHMKRVGRRFTGYNLISQSQTAMKMEAARR